MDAITENTIAIASVLGVTECRICGGNLQKSDPGWVKCDNCLCEFPEEQK